MKPTHSGPIAISAEGRFGSNSSAFDMVTVTVLRERSLSCAPNSRSDRPSDAGAFHLQADIVRPTRWADRHWRSVLDGGHQRSRQRSNRDLRGPSRLLGCPDRHSRHRPATCSRVRIDHHHHVARAQIPIAPSCTLSAPSPAISSRGQLPTPAVGGCRCVPWPASATLHNNGL